MSNAAVDEDLQFRLGLQLIVAHAHDWPKGANLLQRFFAVASESARARSIQQVGWDLMEPGNEFTTETLERLEAIWRGRSAEPHAPELKAFGTWFASSRFAAAGSLDLLRTTIHATRGRIDGEDKVSARLRELASERPHESLDMFSRILDGLEHPWTATRLEADGLVLVRLGLADTNPTVVRIARNIRQRFGMLGYASFAEFGPDPPE